MMPLEATVPDVYVSTVNIFLYNLYDNLEDTLADLNSLKLKSYPGGNISYLNFYQWELPTHQKISNRK